MAKTKKADQESYEGWTITWLDGGPSAEAVTTVNGKVEKITYRTGSDADKRVVRRELTEMIDQANDRMKTPHWQQWRKMRDADAEAAKKENRVPMRIPYEEPPQIGG